MSKSWLHRSSSLDALLRDALSSASDPSAAPMVRGRSPRRVHPPDPNPALPSVLVGNTCTDTLIANRFVFFSIPLQAALPFAATAPLVRQRAPAPRRRRGAAVPCASLLKAAPEITGIEWTGAGSTSVTEV